MTPVYDEDKTILAYAQIVYNLSGLVRWVAISSFGRGYKGTD